MRWDPELVFVGRLYSPDLLLRDARFRTLRAVEVGAVYPLPGGVFFWDGGPESVLLMLWIAKTAHPQLFPELDMGREVRVYYAQFYAVGLDDQQLAYLLAGLGPDGRRIAADLVILAAGIRPNIDLAPAAKLAVNRGILVGDDMATSDPDSRSESNSVQAGRRSASQPRGRHH